MTSPFLLMSKGTIVCWWNPDCRCSSSPVLLGSTAQYLHIYGSFQTIILHPHPRPSTRARKWKAPPNLQSPEPQYLTECSPTWGNPLIRGNSADARKWNPSRLGKGTSNISGILRLCLNMWRYSHENWGSCADRVNVTTWISGMRGTKTIPLRWFQSKTYQEYAHLRYLTWSDRYCLMLPPVGHRWT